MDKKNEPFKLYKANKTNTGSALQLDLNVLKKSVFLDCAKQKDEKIFDWEHKLTIKLSVSDISKILSVLDNKITSEKLFHQPSKGEYEIAKDVKNNVLEITKSQYGYSLRISQQNTTGVNAIMVTISDSESIIIKILLQNAILKIYGW
ncbi:hypothetical protein KO317_02235 [Candidatus Micrarchaeota archaeon]|nr:hypothetical protein [Candidatus Micrarchaeota archaeon]